MGRWGAEVSSVEGISADVVVFEVGLSVQAGGDVSRVLWRVS